MKPTIDKSAYFWKVNKNVFPTSHGVSVTLNAHVEVRFIPAIGRKDGDKLDGGFCCFDLGYIGKLQNEEADIAIGDMLYEFHNGEEHLNYLTEHGFTVSVNDQPLITHEYPPLSVSLDDDEV